MNRKLYNELKAKVESLEKQINGGKGSGNFGHAGRPGKIGGSAPEGVASSKEDKYVPNPFSGLRDTGDSYWGDAKRGISLLDDSKKDMVELARRQYDEDHAKQLKTEIERARELLTMLPEDWAVRIDRVSPGLLETKLATKYKIGDEFTIDGEIMKVVEGDKPGTIMGISEDKKRTTRVPDERLFEIAQLESQTTLDKQNYEVIRKIAEGGRFNEKEAAERIIANIEEWSAKKHNSFTPRLEQLVKNGGKGSGNFGHAGREGKVGGSAPSGSGVKGGTKAEKAKIKSLLEDYEPDRGFEGILEDAKAVGYPNDTNYQKALRWVEGGGAGISYYDAYRDLKEIYGDNFKPETYLTKGGDEDNGDWKYKDGEPYVWTIYKAKLAKAIADEMDKRENTSKNIYKELIAKIDNLAETIVKNGGKGSGNFGHSGRPGEVGGSAPSGTAPQGKTSEKRAYDHLRNNYTKLGFDASLVDTDFADDKAMTIFSSLESSDIMQLAEDKVKADDIYYSLEGNINKYYKEGRDNASNLQSYMQKTNDSINEAINEVVSYGKALAQASQLPEDTKKDFWLMDKDERSNPGNRARTLLDDAERRLLRHESDSEGFTEFAKVSQQRIKTLREVITNYDEINERVLDAPRSDKIIQDPAKKQA